MKDFWKFLAKLVLAIVLVVLIVVLVKKFKRSDSVEDPSENVYYFPTNVGRQGMKMDFATETRLLSSNKNGSNHFEQAFGNLAEDLMRIEHKVDSQERSMNEAVSQTNAKISSIKEKLNSLNTSLLRAIGKKEIVETGTPRTKEEFRFPFAPLDNSCYEPFNTQVLANVNSSKENANKNIQIQPVIKSTSTTTTQPEATNNMDLEDNKPSAATCILIVPRPSIPLDTKINLRKSNEDYRISVAGFIPPKSLDFIIDICIDTKILLHINPKFGEGKIILNSHDTYWDESKEVYAPLSGMYPGNKFQIVVTLQNSLFQIEVNNGDATLFQNRINDTTSMSRHVRIRGVVTLSLLTFELLHDPESASNSSVSNDLLSFPFML